MIEEEPVKLGIIGCGLAARKLHWPCLRQMKCLFEITMVCNHTEPKARTFAELVGNVPYVLDYRDLLASDKVEAVDIVLPIHLNFQVTRDAMQAGKHVIVEKPLAASLTDAAGMVALEEGSRLVTMVAENFRYHPLYLKVKSSIEDGLIGDTYAVFWDVFYKIDPTVDVYAQTQWRIHHKYPGGFVTDAGIHNIAALRYVFGDVIPGPAWTKSINREIGEIDSMSLQFSTPSGVHGVFNFFASTNGFNHNELVVLGTAGTIIVTDNKQLRIRQSDKIVLEETAVDDFGFESEFAAFYHAIRNHQPVLSSFSEAYRDFEVLVTAVQ